ncbi:MAG: DUF3387 domain-containing protein [Rhizonema sp. PD37]|nr:DUF3387 domain-containing protein [Rhizonema sp. PD37]
MLAKYEVVKALFHGFDYSSFFTGTPAQRVSVIPGAMDRILGREDGLEEYLKAVNELALAFALCSSSDEAIAIRDEVGLFQAIRAAFAVSSFRCSLRLNPFRKIQQKFFEYNI